MATLEPVNRKETPFPFLGERTATPQSDLAFVLGDDRWPACISRSQPTLKQPQPVSGQSPSFMYATGGSNHGWSDVPLETTDWSDVSSETMESSDVCWEFTDSSGVRWEITGSRPSKYSYGLTLDFAYRVDSGQSAGTVVLTTSKVNYSGTQPVSPPLPVHDIVVGIRCRKHNGVMQYQTTRAHVESRFYSPIFWSLLEEDGMHSYTVCSTWQDNWLDFGAAEFPDAIKAYLRTKGFGGLFSSITKGEDLPFPVGDGIWNI